MKSVFKRVALSVGVVAGAAILALGALGASAEVPAPKPVTAPTLEQLAAFPKMSRFSVSPDGKHIVAIEGRGEDRVILVWDTANISAPPTTIGAKMMKISSVEFVKDDVLGVTLWQPFDLKTDKTRKTFIYKFMLTDLSGKNWREPLPLPRPKSDDEALEQSLINPQVLDTLPNDPDNILVVNQVGVNSGDVYKVNVRTNKAGRIQRSDESVAGYVTDLEGNLRARAKLGQDSVSTYISLEMRDADGNWSEHFRSHVKDRDSSAVVGFSKDPNIAYLASNTGRDKVVIYEYDVAAKKILNVAFEHKFFDASGVSVWPIKDANFGELMGFEYLGPAASGQPVSPRLVEILKGVNKALGLKSEDLRIVDPATNAEATIKYNMTKSAELVSYSNDLNTAVVMVSGPSSPPVYYLLKDKTKLSLLSRAYPDIDERSLGSMSLIYYKSRDGLMIPGFLTKPNEELCGKGPWKTVVHPHGGPWARDDADWSSGHWTHLLASRCYAVLQPQYRGSDGWGRTLWMAGDAEWGGKMQDDKDDGTQWLIDNGIAIKGRVAMFGFSYGGYASMAAAVRPNGYYKCAIAGAGVSDIKRIWKDFYTNPYYRDGQGPTVKGLSPLDYADKIKIPIYVYHGDRDQIVPIEQSELFVSKAKKSGVDVRYTEFKDYAHGPSWLRTTEVAHFKSIEDYLATGCGGGGL